MNFCDLEKVSFLNRNTVLFTLLFQYFLKHFLLEIIYVELVLKGIFGILNSVNYNPLLYNSQLGLEINPLRKYTRNGLILVKRKYSLRSITNNDLKVPRKPKLKCLGFTYNGAKLLPQMRETQNPNTFKLILNPHKCLSHAVTFSMIHFVLR